MIIEILMPALSPTMTDGTLTKWIKKEGEKVKPGEVIAEIETDKATMEVEAVDEGIIGKILVEAGTNNVAVGKAIALVLEEESDRSALENYQLKGSEKANLEKAQEQPKNETNSKIPQIQKNNDLDRIFASPLAKRIAEQKSVNLKNIEGSGPHGRIVKADVLTASSKPQALGTAQIASKGGYRLEPLSNMRKVIAKRLLESKQTVPHFYLSVDCNLDKLLEMRIEVNSSKDAKHKISVNDFIIKSCAASLAKIPEANSSWSDEGIIHYDDVDIAVAVAIEGGLITPLVRKANLKTLSEISEEMRELASRAREGKLKPEEYQGGGFSISNLGMYGIKQFSAIVNPPQSCILAVGAGIKTPVVIGDAIKISTVAQVTLSCDHRVVDGAVAAKFLSALKDFIENPIKMLV